MTTDAGLLAVRELDEVLGLTEMATCMLSEARANNRRHDFAGLFRQSVYARLAGYEDVNDQEALSRDPAIRAVIGRMARPTTGISNPSATIRSSSSTSTAIVKELACVPATSTPPMAGGIFWSR